jgi:hypothetical protein
MVLRERGRRTVVRWAPTSTTGSSPSAGLAAGPGRRRRRDRPTGPSSRVALAAIRLALIAGGVPVAPGPTFPISPAGLLIIVTRWNLASHLSYEGRSPMTELRGWFLVVEVGLIASPPRRPLLAELCARPAVTIRSPPWRARGT